MRGITLIGMPGAGKSTIGKELARETGRKFFDLDIFIKEKEGKSHVDIAKEKGDQALMTLEEKHTLNLNLTGLVFAPGGSIIYSKPAMDKLCQETLVIFLNQPLEEIRRRLGKRINRRGIVGLIEKGLDGLYAERTALCREFAHKIINCYGRTDLEIIHEILQH